MSFRLKILLVRSLAMHSCHLHVCFTQTLIVWQILAQFAKIHHEEDGKYGSLSCFGFNATNSSSGASRCMLWWSSIDVLDYDAAGFYH